MHILQQAKRTDQALAMVVKRCNGIASLIGVEHEIDVTPALNEKDPTLRSLTLLEIVSAYLGEVQDLLMDTDTDPALPSDEDHVKGFGDGEAGEVVVDSLVDPNGLEGLPAPVVPEAPETVLPESLSLEAADLPLPASAIVSEPPVVIQDIPETVSATPTKTSKGK